MTQDKAVNIGQGQVVQLLEGHGKELGIYTESRRGLFKGTTGTFRFHWYVY